jgi:hypothetical protein
MIGLSSPDLVCSQYFPSLNRLQRSCDVTPFSGIELDGEVLMISEDQVIEKVQNLLSHQMTLDSFSAWLASDCWNQRRDSSADAIRMIGRINAWLAEFDNEHLSEDELIQNLRNIQVVREVGCATMNLQVSTTGPTQSQALKTPFVWSAGADKRLEKGSLFARLSPQAL